jgi:hypothetical protein
LGRFGRLNTDVVLWYTMGHTHLPPNFFVVDGYDLTMVLMGAIELADFLRVRRRLLCDEGSVFVQFNDLYSGSRAV